MVVEKVPGLAVGEDFIICLRWDSDRGALTSAGLTGRQPVLPAVTGAGLPDLVAKTSLKCLISRSGNCFIRCDVHLFPAKRI